MGISESSQRMRNISILVKTTMAFVFLVQFLASTITYFVIEAKSFTEYIDTFFVIATIALNIFSLIIFTSNKKNIFQLIQKIEEMIEKRELYF